MTRIVAICSTLLFASSALADAITLSCIFNNRSENVWTYVIDISNAVLVLSKLNDKETAARVPLTLSDNELKWTVFINNGRDPMYYTLDRTTLRLKLVNTFDRNFTYFYDCKLVKKMI